MFRPPPLTETSRTTELETLPYSVALINWPRFDGVGRTRGLAAVSLALPVMVGISLVVTAVPAVTVGVAG